MDVRMDAIKPYSIGDVIYKSSPLVYVTVKNKRGIICDYCMKENTIDGDFKRCSNCQIYYYCSIECQRGAWRDHKSECMNLKNISPKVPTADARLFYKFVMIYKRDKNSNFERFQNKIRTIKDLASHCVDIMKDKERSTNFEKLIHQMIIFSNDSIFMDKKLCLVLYGKMLINTISILNYDQTEAIGSGIYLGMSSLNHDCRPNCVPIFIGKDVLIKAVKDIKDGEELTISYVVGPQPSKLVQKELLERYYFKCECLLCADHYLDPMQRSFVCQGCTLTVKLPTNDCITECTYCYHKHDIAFIQSIRAINNNLAKVLKSCEKYSYSKKEDLTILSSLLYANYTGIGKRLAIENCFLLNLYMALYELHLNLREFDKCRVFVDLIVEGYTYYFTKYDIRLLIMMVVQKKIANYLGKPAPEECTNDLYSALHRMFGKDSDLCNKILDGC